MSYLTFTEYQALGFNKIKDKQEFDALELYAELHLNRITADYYVKHDLTQETNEYRVKKVKLAMAMQVDYLQLNGGSTTLQELLSDSVGSVSVGRMRIEGGNTSAATYGKTLFSTEAYAELLPTGLLYRGVAYR